MHTEAIFRGQQVVLVPSTPDHVEKYYHWMTDPKLLKETGTDPLSLEEVYEMEKHWREDHDSKPLDWMLRQIFKSARGHVELTFIILANGEGDIASLPMVGDVNVFLKDDPSDEEFEVEVGVMVAEESYRGKGCALEALRLMLSYVTGSYAFFATPPLACVPDPPLPFPIRLENLVVRVGRENEASIRLFGRLGFVETKGANAFGEKEMRILQHAGRGTPA